MRPVPILRPLGLALLLVSTAIPAPADEGAVTVDGVAPVSPAPSGDERFDELLLRDGTLLKGTIVEETDDTVAIEVESLGRLQIDRDQIASLHRRGSPYGAVTDPDRNSIMFCPTPETIDRGKGYFRNFELFVLNFGFGLTDRLDFSLGTLFPISADVMLASLGVKLKLLDREELPIGAALTTGGTFHQDGQAYAFGAVIGGGSARHSLNLWVNRFATDDGDGETVFLVAGDAQVSRRTKVFAEYGNGSNVFEDGDDFNGFINVGVRIFGQRMAFALSGVRPIEETGDFLFFPVAMFSAHW